MSNILLIVSIFGFILTTLLILKRDVNRVSTIFLALLYFIISVYCLQTWVIETGLLIKTPWFYGWPLPIYALTPVAVFFYFTSVCNDKFKFKWIYLALFIPFLLSLIDIINLFVKPTTFFHQIVHNAIENPKGRFYANYGMINLMGHYTIRNLWILLSLIFIYPMLRVFFQWDSSQKSKKKLNNWLKFLFLNLFVLSALSTLFGIQDIFNVKIFEFIFRIKSAELLIIFIFYIMVLLLGIAPLYFPSILYGFPQHLSPINLSKISHEEVKSEASKFGLDELEIQKKLQIMEESEIYLLANFDLTMLASAIQMPIHHVSYFLNQNYEMSFAAYRNKLRMEFAKKLISKGFFGQNTIEALAWKCGFSSRSAFVRTFKTYTGINPSEYS